ncbi:MAG: helix-turn-helix domain-containing protein [bacterium]
MKAIIPDSVRSEIRRQESVPPILLTPKDREDFLRSVPEDLRSDAETHWNDMVKENERKVGDFLDKIEQTGQMRRVQYLTVKQVADRWQVSERQVWRLIGEGRLKSVKIGECRRIDEAAVRAFEQSNRATAA